MAKIEHMAIYLWNQPICSNLFHNESYLNQFYLIIPQSIPSQSILPWSIPFQPFLCQSNQSQLTNILISFRDLNESYFNLFGEKENRLSLYQSYLNQSSLYQSHLNQSYIDQSYLSLKNFYQSILSNLSQSISKLVLSLNFQNSVPIGSQEHFF